MRQIPAFVVRWPVAAALSALVFLLACSEPQCPPGRVKIGTACLRKQEASDAAVEPEESSAEESERVDGAFAPTRDGAVLDAGGQPDGDDAIACAAEREGRCEPGTPVACSTACGTAGVGICSPLCGPPDVSRCSPPLETCNGLDDDCDGVTDPGLVSRLSGGVRAWTADTTALGSIVLLPRSPSGLWLFYRPGDAGEIVAQALDEYGSATPLRVSLPDTAELSFWTVGADADHIVLAGTRVDRGATVATTIDLQSYSSSTLQLLDRRDVDGGSCEVSLAESLAVARDAAGAVRVAFTRYRTVSALNADGSCGTTQTSMDLSAYFLGLTPAGRFTTQRRAMLLGDASYSRVVRVPCADQWLVTWVSTSNSGGRRFSLSGGDVASHAGIIAGKMLWDVAAAPDDRCEGDQSTFFVATESIPTATGSAGRPELTVLTFDRKLDAFVRAVPPVPVSSEYLSELRVLGQGGRVLVSAIDTHSTLRLIELTRDGLNPRQIDLMPVETPKPEYDNKAYESLYYDVTALAAAGKNLVVGTSMTPRSDGAAAYRQIGDTAPPVALTYSVGCR